MPNCTTTTITVYGDRPGPTPLYSKCWTHLSLVLRVVDRSRDRSPAVDTSCEPNVRLGYDSRVYVLMFPNTMSPSPIQNNKQYIYIYIYIYCLLFIIIYIYQDLFYAILPTAPNVMPKTFQSVPHRIILGVS